MKGSGRAVWDDLVSPDDLAALDPGVPSRWDASPDLMVVGGGAIGLAAATFCRREGMSVLLVERGRLAEAASGRAAGGLSPDAHPELGEAWHVLARRSLGLHRELDAQWGYGLRTLDLVVPARARIPDQAHVDPLKFAAALARRAGVVATGVVFTDWDANAGHVVRARTSRGEVTPGCVVLATGTAPAGRGWTGECWIKGHLIATEPAGLRLREMVADGEVLVVQLPDGRLVAGGTQDRDDETEIVDEAVAARIERRLGELVPEASGVRRTHAWCCFRPCAADECPVIDLVPGLDNAWIATGLFTTGLLMAPIVGRLLSEWISTGHPREIASFGLDRLGGAK